MKHWARFAGRSTGEAYVEFASAEAAADAIAAKQKGHLRHRYIE